MVVQDRREDKDSEVYVYGEIRVTEMEEEWKELARRKRRGKSRGNEGRELTEIVRKKDSLCALRQPSFIVRTV